MLQNSTADVLQGWSNETKEIFINHYWQSKPVLIRSFISNISNHINIDRHMLLELSTEDDVESRLIKGQGEKWEKTYGPFDIDEFSSLPRRKWTLLVQVGIISMGIILQSYLHSLFVGS
jgi:50S ribosomal protein L16 3-hydroxylase